MQYCKGCRQQQTTSVLCLPCIEDLTAWLREIPDLYSELGSVRLPGSTPTVGPSVRTGGGGSQSPVRLVVVDLLDRGETLRRLWEWSGDDRSLDVAAICDGFRHHLPTIVDEPWAPDFHRAIRALCRDLGRAVGQPEERSVGKCCQPRDDELCRGQLFRSDTGGVYCRRCGDKPQLLSRPVWVTLEDAARLIGKPIETVRTWYKRGKLTWRPVWLDHGDSTSGWSGPIGPQPARRAWLPSAVRLADGDVATLPLGRDSVNHGSRAEPSVATPAADVEEPAPDPLQATGAGCQEPAPDPLQATGAGCQQDAPTGLPAAGSSPDDGPAGHPRAGGTVS